MSPQHHEHEHHGHQHEHHQREEHNKRRGLHKDWRAWLVVGLMLVAMVIYVLSMDESIRPGGVVGEPMPAAPAAP